MRPCFKNGRRNWAALLKLLLLRSLDETDRNLGGGVLIVNAFHLPGLARPNCP
jgi:hypothetical protein